MKVYGKCICTGLNNASLDLYKSYQIIINEEDNSFTLPDNKNFTKKFDLECLDIYFKLYLSKEGLINILKKNLEITDKNIIEFKEKYLKETILIKYNDDFIYLHIFESGQNYSFSLSVNVKSNNLARQKEYEFEFFKDDIIKFCDILKFMHS